MRNRFQKVLDELDDPNNVQTTESRLRILVAVLEQMRKEGTYKSEDMVEIIKRADESVQRF